MKSIYRDVRTGRLVKRSINTKHGYRLGEDWFQVSAHECVMDCICDGFEICLHHISRGIEGGAASGPVWPIISCGSEKETLELVKKLVIFARTLDPKEDQFEYFDKEINGDTRLAAWLGTEKFHKRNHNMWTREAA